MYIVQRFVRASLILLSTSIMLFWATNVLPGDTAQAILGKDATPEAIENTRTNLGLNRPFVVRYIEWVSGILHLDFGKSLTQGIYVYGDGSLAGGISVYEIIKDPIINSSILAFTSMLLVIMLSLGIGVFSALNEGSLMDRGIQISVLIMLATPEFVIGIILVSVFSMGLHLLPAVSFQVTLSGLILPVMTLTLSVVGATSRMLRSTIIEKLASEYIVMAQLRGIPMLRVMFRHLLPNVLPPTIQLFAMLIPLYMGGMIVVEYVFAYPGIGQGMVNAISGRDYPVIQAYGIVIVFTYVCSNVAADWLSNLSNPRLHEES